MANADVAFSDSFAARLKRLKGRLTWTLETEYHARLTEFDRNLRSLDEAMAVAQAEYDQYVRARQAASHSYIGYDTPIKRLRAKARESVSKVELLMARQGRLLEVVAIEELMARRSHLENYGDKARFALADSYDRATQAQAKVSGE
jgi:chromosome segregation ATPase